MNTHAASPLSPEEIRRRARRTLTLIFLVCAAPVVLGTLAFYFWAPTGRTNYGDLLPLTRLELSGRTPAGEPFDGKPLAGKWVLVTYDDGACAEACEKKLYFTRQVRIAQGRDQERMERLWIRTSPTATRAEAEPLLAGLFVEHAAGSGAPPALAGEAATHIYLMDPMGNVMLRFPTDPDPKRMIQDIQKLLRVNNRVN